jgi:hypothetical protein
MTEQPAGPDLARQALASWKATAKKTTATGATKPRKKRRAQYGDGRDPVGLGSVLTRLGEENEWKTAVQGGSILDRWPELCPDLIGKVAPVAFDAASGRLDLRPASPTYATHLRLLGPQLVTRLQAKGTPVRTLRVLTPGALPNQAAVIDDEAPAAAPEAPIRTRADATPGYRAALEAHQKHARTDHGNTALKEAIAAAANRAPVLRERDCEFTDAEAFREDLEERAAKSADARARALAVARAEKAGCGPIPPTVFQRTA